MIEGSVSVIGSYAFYNLVYVKTITIPKSVTDIEQYAFDGCDKLSKAYYAGSESDWDEVYISRMGNENLTVYTTVIYNSKTEEGEPTIPDTEGRKPKIGKTTLVLLPRMQ